MARAEWIQDRQSELLSVPYFHVVFTVPEEIAEIALQNKRTVYGILFRATAETLSTIAADPQHLGAKIGFFAVLHTWGQNLLAHPHLHCIVPGGGISPDGTRWISCRPNFFLPVRVLSRLFRRLFLKYLEKAFDSGKLRFSGSLAKLKDPGDFRSYLAPLKKTEWVVYAKPPFGGPQQVLDYVGRYTHRVAISNNRLLGIENNQIRFHWKDYRDNNQQKTMTLPAEEFIRRFLLHVLPDGFQRIRYYGFLSNRDRDEKLALCRQLLGMPALDPEPVAGDQPSDYDDNYVLEQLRSSLRKCPVCQQGRMIVAEVLAPTGCEPSFDTSGKFQNFHDSKLQQNDGPSPMLWQKCAALPVWMLREPFMGPVVERTEGFRSAPATGSYQLGSRDAASTACRFSLPQVPSAIQYTFAIQQPQPSHPARGLVQSVFSSPPRLATSRRNLKHDSPRR